MSEASVEWASSTISELNQTLQSLSLSPEVVDVGARGQALAVRTEADYYVTIFAPVAEGPSTVVVSTGVFRAVDARPGDVLSAINAYNRTRGVGRCVATKSSDGQLLLSLHETVVPAIFTNVPPFFRAYLTSFNPLAARKVLRANNIDGSRWLWASPSDVALLLDAVDDDADILLDFDELMNPEK